MEFMRMGKTIAVGTLLVLVLSPVLGLGHGNERGVVTAHLGGGKVTVEHGRPMAKGRDVMSMIQPGAYWRMGSDQATTLATEVDLIFGEKTVPKGKYTLVAHFLGGGKWALVVAQGAARGTWEPQGVVAELAGSLSKTESPVEMLTIKLEAQGTKARFVLEWGESRLSTEFRAA